ncbi:MAG: hypothetical protein ACYSR9_14830 [Planctomycetota bacterium]|jgi:hypothetical protein
MRIISFIEDSEIKKKILKHLGWCDVKRKVPPLAHGPPIKAYTLDNSSPIPCLEDYLIDADYPVEAYL